MKPDSMLMIPGPTPVPASILEVMARPPIGHRSPEFKTILTRVFDDLKWVFQTKQPVLLYTASGTGAMEAALVNTLNAGDDVLVLACGVFSNRWAEIAKTLGLNVHLLSVPAGEPNLPGELETFLKGPEGSKIKAVCMIHSETSTGVLNDVKTLAATVKAHSEALIIVDTVTSLGATDFRLDEWGIDIAVSGSQKGFMIHPGLSFIAISERALAKHQQCKNPGYYFNFSKNIKSQEQGQTAYTPATSLIRGLEAALGLMKEEGLENIFKRHQLNQSMVRAAATAMGLNPLVKDDAFASTAVTSIVPPEGVTVDDIRAGIKNQFGITIANGQKELQGKIFRIGHLGAIFPRDVLTVMSSLEVVLSQLGYKVPSVDAGRKAAQEVLIHHG